METSKAMKVVKSLTHAQREELESMHYRYMCFAGITTSDADSEKQAEADREKYGHLLKFTEDGTPILSDKQAAEFMSAVSGLAKEVCEAWDVADFYDTHGISQEDYLAESKK